MRHQAGPAGGGLLCDEICVLKKGTPVFRGTVEQAKALCRCERFEDAYLRLSDEEVDA